MWLKVNPNHFAIISVDKWKMINNLYQHCAQCFCAARVCVCVCISGFVNSFRNLEYQSLLSFISFIWNQHHYEIMLSNVYTHTQIQHAYTDLFIHKMQLFIYCIALSSYRCSFSLSLSIYPSIQLARPAFLIFLMLRCCFKLCDSFNSISGTEDMFESSSVQNLQ